MTVSATCCGVTPSANGLYVATEPLLMSTTTLGYIEERAANAHVLRVVVTEAGRNALNSRGN
jgi:hypothetical protein